MKNICQPVSEVIIGAPYVLTDELLEQYNVSVRSRTFHRATFSRRCHNLFSPSAPCLTHARQPKHSEGTEWEKDICQVKRESTETEAKSEKEVRRWLLVARASLTTMTAMRTRVSTRTQPRRGGNFKFESFISFLP